MAFAGLIQMISNALLVPRRSLCYNGHSKCFEEESVTIGTMQATMTDLAPPASSRLSVKIEISTEINVSAPIARQQANRFLIMQVGDQLVAGEPELLLGPTVYWRLPVRYAPSRLGPLGVVGHLLVSADTGQVTIADHQTADDLLAASSAQAGAYRQVAKRAKEQDEKR